jgi:hypothetical protein
MGILRLQGTLVLSLRESRLRHRELMKMLGRLVAEAEAEGVVSGLWYDLQDAQVEGR